MKFDILQAYFRSLSSVRSRDSREIAAELRRILVSAGRLARPFPERAPEAPAHVLLALADAKEDELFLYALPEASLTENMQKALESVDGRTIGDPMDVTSSQWAAWARVALAIGVCASAEEGYDELVEQSRESFDDDAPLPTLEECRAWLSVWVPYFASTTTFGPAPERLDVRMTRVVSMLRA